VSDGGVKKNKSGCSLDELTKLTKPLHYMDRYLVQTRSCRPVTVSLESFRVSGLHVMGRPIYKIALSTCRYSDCHRVFDFFLFSAEKACSSRLLRG